MIRRPIQPATTSNNGGSHWKTYRSEELGFRFSYPEKWGEMLDPSIQGRMSEFDQEFGLFFIIQNIYFPSNDFSVVAHPRESCPQGDDYRLTIGQGYVFKNGEYFSRWCNDRKLIQRSGDIPHSGGFKIVNTVNTEAIMWVDDCPFSGCNAKLIKASVNLQKDKFPGVGLAMIWEPTVVFNKGEAAVNAPVSFEKLLAEFESVIRTIELTNTRQVP